MNWVHYGLFITSLPQLAEFLPTDKAHAVQSFIAAHIGPRTTFWLFIFGVFFAAFLAWKQKDDEVAGRVDERTLNDLARQLDASNELANRVVASAAEYNQWLKDFRDWHSHVYETIASKLSYTDATLFNNLGTKEIKLLVNPHSFSPEHNKRRFELVGFQDNLHRLLERHS